MIAAPKIPAKGKATLYIAGFEASMSKNVARIPTKPTMPIPSMKF